MKSIMDILREADDMRPHARHIEWNEAQQAHVRKEVLAKKAARKLIKQRRKQKHRG